MTKQEVSLFCLIMQNGKEKKQQQTNKQKTCCPSLSMSKFKDTFMLLTFQDSRSMTKVILNPVSNIKFRILSEHDFVHTHSDYRHQFKSHSKYLGMESVLKSTMRENWTLDPRIFNSMHSQLLHPGPTLPRPSMGLLLLLQEMPPKAAISKQRVKSVHGKWPQAMISIWFIQLLKFIYSASASIFIPKTSYQFQ